MSSLIRCPITYEPITTGKYSQKGLKRLSPIIERLQDFSYSSKQQLELALEYATKLSIQGVQPKLSVRLTTSKGEGRFECVERGGTFIFKPPHPTFAELPQNEDLTMHLATFAGIRIPLHGLIYNIDGTMTYFIQRFDRLPKGRKLGVEDFSQLMGYSRETKYDSSMEKLIAVIDKHCTFPMIEKLRLFELCLFNFIVGNEDMHLKNFSLIRRENRVELSPAYDLVNSSIVINAKEEIALPLRGKRSNLKREDFVEYYGMERLGLSPTLLQEVLKRFEECKSSWKMLIDASFLSPAMKQRYLEVIKNRFERLHF